jgi:hypothetical protein
VQKCAFAKIQPFFAILANQIFDFEQNMAVFAKF